MAKPYFDGKGSLPVDEWFEQVEKMMQPMEIEESVKILLLGTRLTGTALQLSDQYLAANKGNNYVEFKKEMFDY